MMRRIDRPTIIAAARAMIERDGVAGLSMRRLAESLDSKPMSLYYYVPSKDALLLAVLAEVAGEIPWTAPADDAPPSDRMVQVVTDMAERLRAIDWVIDILREGTHVGVPALALADRFLDAAIEAGMSDQSALDTWRACWYLVASELQFQRSVQLRPDGATSWYDRVGPEQLDHAPTVRRMLPDWSNLSARFDLAAAVRAQVMGAIATTSR